ncbi:hypothetical protein TKK_0019442 [Trichogramma kaykai]
MEFQKTLNRLYLKQTKTKNKKLLDAVEKNPSTSNIATTSGTSSTPTTSTHTSLPTLTTSTDTNAPQNYLSNYFYSPNFIPQPSTSQYSPTPYLPQSHSFPYSFSYPSNSLSHLANSLQIPNSLSNKSHNPSHHLPQDFP